MSLEEFKAAKEFTARGPKIGEEPDNDTKLSMYAHFKQATQGPNKSPKPGAFNIVGQFKWKAWKALGEMSAEEARKVYVATMDKGAPGWRDWAKSQGLISGSSSSTTTTTTTSSEKSEPTEALFKGAQDYIAKGPPAETDNKTKLTFYAAFKQATKGDCTGKRPGVFSPVARAKYDAWKALSGTDKKAAMQKYIDALAAVAPNWTSWAKSNSPHLTTVAAAGKSSKFRGTDVPVPPPGWTPRPLPTPTADKPLLGRVAIVTGSTRGIGKEVAATFARAGANVVITGKSTSPQPTLPGTIFTVAKEMEAYGVKALPCKVDVRSVDDVSNMINKTIAAFGRIDICVCNASALWWKSMEETPMKRYDLMNSVNARGTFLTAKAASSWMAAAKTGHVIIMSPPIDLRMIPNKVGYCISKFGMTMVAHGLAAELKPVGVNVNAIWPATIIESYASINFKLGDKSMWRKASILADTCMLLVNEKPGAVTGRALIDEDYMRTKGITDFTKYRCDPDVEPPRALAAYPDVGAVSETPSASLNAAAFNASTPGDTPKMASAPPPALPKGVSSAMLEQVQAGIAALPPLTAMSTDKPAALPSPNPHLAITIKGGIMTMRLNRESSLNAINTRMYHDMAQAFRHASGNPDVRVVVMTGTGKYFCAGNDMADFKKANKSIGAGVAIAQATSNFMRTMATFTKPIIVALNGHATGIGVTLLAHADFVYAMNSADLWTPFVPLGLVPENASSWLFPRIMSRHWVSEFLIHGRRVSAADGVRAGLVGAVMSSPQELAAVTAQKAREIAQLEPRTVVAAKTLIMAPQYKAMQDTYASENLAFFLALTSPEFDKAVKSFYERKKTSARL